MSEFWKWDGEWYLFNISPNALTISRDYAIIEPGDSMYNQEIKERFLSEYDSKSSYVSTRSTLLDNIGEYEKFLCKDIAEMTKDEAVRAINSLEMCEYSTATTSITTLKAYAKWCKVNGYFKESNFGISEITIDDVDPTSIMSKILFRDENDFIYSMRKVRSFDEGYPEVVYLALAWLGVDQKYALIMKDSAVDLVNRKIYDEKGNVIVNQISDGVLFVLTEFVRCNVVQRENGTSVYDLIKDLSVDRFIKKFCVRSSEKMGQPFSTNQIWSSTFKLNRAYTELGYAPRFTYTNVQESGGLYRIWQLEQSGVDVFAKKNIPLVLSAFGKSKQYTKVIWKYKFYKKAFNL